MAENEANKRKLIKKILILLAVTATLIAIYQLANIYALFQSTAVGEVENEIAKWKILVNKEDIVKGIEVKFDIGEFTIVGENVLEGKFAPGTEGYFEIIIEPQDTQVAVRYDITIDTSEIDETDIYLVSLEELVKGPLDETEQGIYTGIIPLLAVENGDSHTIRITFMWESSSGSQGDTIIDGVIEIPVIVNVKQYLGELD